jgi:glycosyltransferase involved in cell wall biosynthesis
MPKVSVVIPTHNRTELLLRAIKSVLAQTVQHFEIIVVDDASSVDVVGIVDVFGDNRIKIIRHEECKGGSASRNTGIAYSQGEFVAFLDDDDEWCHDKLEAQLAFMHRHQVLAMVYTGYFLVNQNTGWIKEVYRPHKELHLSKLLLRDNVIGTTSTIMVRKACLTGDIKFDENLKSCQDWDFYLKIAGVYQIGCISRPLVRHHDHDERISGRFADVIQGHQAILERINQNQKYTISKKVTAHHHYKLAKLFLEFGDHEKGRWELLRSLAIYRCRPGIYVYLAASYLRSSDYRQMSACWQFLKSVRSRFFARIKTS